METSSNTEDDQQQHLKQQEEKLRAKYGGMIPKKNLIVSDRKHFDSADYWSRGSNTQQHKQVETEKNSHFVESGADSSSVEKMLKPVLGAKDVAGFGTSPPSDASTFTTNNNSSQTKRRTSMDESRGRWDVHSFNNNNNTAVNSAYHAPKNHE